MKMMEQKNLFDDIPGPSEKSKRLISKKKIGAKDAISGTFADNLKLPVHRWFRYSAGFSAEWVKKVIIERNPKIILDPFVGSGTVCVAADEMGIKSFGIESHPFVCRLAIGKMAWAYDVAEFSDAIVDLESAARKVRKAEVPRNDLLRKCYTDEAFAGLSAIRSAFTKLSPSWPSDLNALVFLAINAILRQVSHVGTAQWQYVLPNKRKAKSVDVITALHAQVANMCNDMSVMQKQAKGSLATLIQGDARVQDGVPNASVDLAITSPPYPNNYDYADATRLEMTFWGEVETWGDLQNAVRKFLMRSSSQHVAADRLVLDHLLENPIVAPIREPLTKVCRRLDEVRGTKGGKKQYHTMIAAYYTDMAYVFSALRKKIKKGGAACFVIGDSAPYGVYAPADEWLGELAKAAGFKDWSFEKIRDRNIKWKNRKHTVPLKEGRLWIEG